MNEEKNQTIGAADFADLNGLKELIKVIASVSDEDLLRDFFECLFTSAELKDINNRWLLVKEIENGTTQREIARMFKMSLCKITRGSKELKKENSAFKKMLGIAKENGMR
ncbi:MAG: trp operon repressor [Bacteroides sp.]|nr:trp operon repressor [Prevotella sp.]MCM1408700.1 trp operon repressor [Treponema brennaborense]MCM1470561.1 trp operon repressor [Bacteroides sp.]